MSLTRLSHSWRTRLMIAVAGGIALSVATYPSHAGQGCPPAETFPTHLIPVGQSTDFIRARDVNRDGHLDLLGGVSRLWTVLGAGDGSFSDPLVSQGQFDARGDLALGDFNEDGFVDVAASDYSNNTLTIHLGRGDGFFDLTATLPIGFRPAASVAADFDNDGHVDVATANDDGFRIAFGNGDGSFVLGEHVPVGISTRFIDAADLNDDTLPDVVVDDYETYFVVFFNNGDRTFSFNQRFPTPGGHAIRDFKLGNLIGDSHPDLVFTLRGSFSQFYIYESLPGGWFVTLETIDLEVIPHDIGLADLDNDADLDVALSIFGSDAVLVLLNMAGTFSDGFRYSTGARPRELDAGDVNEDGFPEILVGTAGDVTILFNRGDGTFDAPITLSMGAYYRETAVGDLNGDALPDVVGVGGLDDPKLGQGWVRSLLAVGDGSFVFGDFVDTSVWALTTVAIGEFDGDTYSDVACAGRDASLAVLHGLGDGTFAVERDYEIGWPPHDVASGDFDGDSHLDVVATNGADDTVSVLLYSGFGSFEPQVVFPVGTAPYGVATGFVNGDAFVDIVTANSGSDDVSILLGNGDGTFLPQMRASAGTAPRNVALFDANGDGLTDLAVANTGSNDVSVLLGNGDGTFLPQQRFPVDGQAMDVATADFTRDGNPDLAVAVSTDQWALLAGNGDGTFQPAVYLATENDPQAIATGDFNLDGAPDVFVTVFGDGMGHVFLNTCTAGIAGDFDGDGDVDIADFSFFVTCFGGSGVPCSGQCCAADLDGDGDVDIADFAIFSTNFTGSQ